MKKKFGSVQEVTQEELLSAMIGSKKHSRSEIKRVAKEIKERKLKEQQNKKEL
jgi:hypothetical protein